MAFDPVMVHISKGMVCRACERPLTKEQATELYSRRHCDHQFTTPVEWEYVEREVEVPDYGAVGAQWPYTAPTKTKHVMSRVGERVTVLRCSQPGCDVEVHRE